MPKGCRCQKNHRPKVCFVTSDPATKSTRLYDEKIWFDSLKDQASHSYQLRLVGRLIAQCYAHLIQEEELAT